MKLSLKGRLVALMTTVTLAFTGYGGAGTTVPLDAMTQSQAHQASGKSWMLPQAKSEDLIYAVGGCGGACILSYPKGKLVAELTGVDGGADCSDNDGNVFISEQTEVVEFAHGGTNPIATYATPYTPPLGCSVDPESGSLAVVNQNSVAVFSAGSQQNPTTYATHIEAQYCGYDNSGNLFVNGFDGENFALSELPNGASSFESLTLDQSVGNPGQLQWDGRYLTYESQSRGQPTISRLSIAGSTATVVGQTRLKRLHNFATLSWINKGYIVAPYSVRGPSPQNVGTWKYPTGALTKRITRFGDFDRKTFDFTAATISVGN